MYTFLSDFVILFGVFLHSSNDSFWALVLAV